MLWVNNVLERAIIIYPSLIIDSELLLPSWADNCSAIANRSWWCKPVVPLAKISVVVATTDQHGHLTDAVTVEILFISSKISRQSSSYVVISQLLWRRSRTFVVTDLESWKRRISLYFDVSVSALMPQSQLPSIFWYRFYLSKYCLFIFRLSLSGFFRTIVFVQFIFKCGILLTANKTQLSETSGLNEFVLRQFSYCF